jgi:RimJ/RimL family protein N-acetyltransferase
MGSKVDFFQSERLIYRAFDSPKDDEFYSSFHQDYSVYPGCWKGLLTPPSKKNGEAIRKILEEGLLLVVICKKPAAPGDEPEPIGILSVKKIMPELAHNRCGDIGIELKAEEQKHGYGTEAVRWVLGWAFIQANLHRVGLDVYEWNAHAIEVYKKVGFKEEGRLRESIWRDGQWWDEILMGILESEWKEKYVLENHT